ncbi:hypothetical protein [Pigmentiphaga litoralis]|uniref:Uncharacterized protein n=1 Tax=Pigmentiphaga litoralis TaxID=516702 RepID=A0A7Y9IXM8_9BURK|nr:hypothetical protein [Pigmentiphaga litoralis]NYE25786.1 hypothetical protein [Pigmentiphaga litoralis]NYE84906.1 hypothetical protein [Pigmentiphaga litoralis]
MTNHPLSLLPALLPASLRAVIVAAASVLPAALWVLPLALSPASAMASDAVLLSAADGPAFSIGSTPYQVVTAARAVPNAAAGGGSAGSGHTGSGSVGSGSDGGSGSGGGSTGNGLVTRDAIGAPAAVVGRIGNYRITLGGTNGYVTQSAASSEYAVAVNRRTGGPALVSRRLKLFKVSADQAASVARQTGGSVEIAVSAASMAVLLYASPAAALVALEAIQGGGGGAQAEPEVIQAFMTPR